MEFEWDQNKANSNLEKHRVSFDEVITVLKILYTLIFLILIIPIMNIDIL